MCCLLRGSCQREPESREIETPSYSKTFKFHRQTNVFFPPIRKRIVKSKENYDKASHNLRKISKDIDEVAYLIAKDKKTHSIEENPHQTCCHCNQSNYGRRQGNRGNKRNTIVCRYYLPTY